MNNKTLLSTVQRVLSDLNFEQVNSIFDTDDSEAVARIVLNVHSAVLTEYPWVIKDTLVSPLRIDLTTISVPRSAQRIRKVKYHASKKCTSKTPYKDSNKDVWMPRSAGNECEQCSTAPHISSRESDKYSYWKYEDTSEHFTVPDRDGWSPSCNGDKDEDCTELTFLEMDEFLQHCIDVGKTCPEDCPVSEFVCTPCGSSISYDLDPIPNKPERYHININNNKDPEYWTVINGDIVLDSFCFRDGTRIQDSRLMLIGQNVGELSLSDNQIIDLPLEFYNYLMAEILSTASYTLIDKPNEKEEARSQRLRRRLLREHGLQGRKRTSIGRPDGSYWRK